MKKYLALLLTLVLVVAVSVMAVSAATGDIDFSAGGTVSAVCPHCGGDNEVQWLPLTQELVNGWYDSSTKTHDYSLAEGTHYYLSEESIKFTRAMSIGAKETLCLHLNGKTVTRAGARAFSIDGTLNLMDHAANEGLVTCLASNSSGGSVIRVNGSNGVFNMRGGILELRVNTAKDAESMGGNGGCVWLKDSSKFNMYGGIIKDGIAGDGGNVYLSSKAQFKMYGGTIKNGKTDDVFASTTDTLTDTQYGGNIYLASSAVFEMYGGTVDGGFAANYGGNIYLATSAVFEMYGGTIIGGNAIGSGGNIFATGAQISISDGTIADGDAARYGGNMFCENSAVSISGGTISGGHAVNTGGNVFTQGSNGVTISGGTITGGSADDRGGNVYMASVTSYLTISGGTITKGSATNSGGNIYANNGNFTVTGGVISEGQAANGGNIYTNVGNTNKSNVATVGDDNDASTPAPVICDGVATKFGGNIFVKGPLTVGVCTISDGEVTGRDDNGGGNFYGTSTLTLTGTTVIGGNARYGGSIWVTKCTVNAGTSISGGYATSRGGNFYLSSTTSNLTVLGGTISGGRGFHGGNIHANNGNVNILGGTISEGTGKGGGNIYAGNASSSNCVLIDDDGDASTPLPVISGGIATDASLAGGNILVEGYVSLGNCIIKDGVAPTSGKDVMLEKDGKLKVLSDFSAECGIDFVLTHTPLEANGEYLDATIDTCEGPFTGKLYWDADPGRPYLFGKEGDTKLYLTAAALVNKDGTYTFYKSNEELVAADSSNAVAIRPVAGELKLTGGNYVVDLCGRDVNITGTGNVSCYDSANSDFKTNGTATFDGPVLQNTAKATVAGAEYYTTNDNGAYAFHLLDMRLTSVAVRPSNTGIYYQGVWLCDEALADKIDTFGVAVSVVDLPDTDFRDDKATLYTQFTKSEFVVGSERSGVLIKDILVEGATNNTSRSKRDIYAAAYIVFKDGSVAITDDNIAYSLYDAATIVAQNPETFATSVQAMHELQEKWKVNWKLNFEVDPDVLQLQTVYAGKSVYHGELHDHSKSGKNADGKLTPNQWKIGLKQKNMDFAALVDHRQIEHMFADFWDPTIFIGGSEAAAMISDLPSGKNKIHINMLFAEAEGFVNTVSSFAPFRYKDGYFSYPYDSNAISREQVKELIGLIKQNGGMFVHVHPKSPGYIVSENPLDYWFEDWTGLEVFYGYYNYAPDYATTKNNYILWTELLALGKRVWATAGCDQHSVPKTTALTTIYADARNATAWMNEAKKGNLVCGPVGIRMSIGDTPMGSQTSFAGKRLVLSVGDIHDVAYYEDHTYRFDVLSDTGVVYSQAFDPDTTTYYGMDADTNVKFYRVEVFDTTTDTRIAIGNPIWNEAFYD